MSLQSMLLHLCACGEILQNAYFPAFNPIGFTAYAVVDAQFNEGERIKFDGVFSNEGLQYDAVNSIFVCPITGLYMFTVNVYTTNRSRMEALLRVVDFAGAFKFVTAYSSNQEPNGSSNSVVVMCEEGWTVDVVCGPYNTCEYNTEFDGVNSFSGVLITELI